MATNKKIPYGFQTLPNQIQGDVTKRLRIGYRLFSLGTSMHGFAEIYKAKSTVFKGFWIVLIGIALGFTIVQFNQATDEYINQSSLTSIVPAKSVLYPPLKLCVNHWIQWLDYSKAISLGYTKKAILYGLSSMFQINSVEYFDIDAAENEYNHAQTMNNVSGFSDFFKSVAKSVDELVEYVYAKDEETVGQEPVSNVFDEITVEQNRVCYRANSDKLKQFIEPGQNEAFTNNLLVFILKQQAFLPDLRAINLTPLEYAWNIVDWFAKSQSAGAVNNGTYQPRGVPQKNGKYVEGIENPDDYSNIAIPLSLYVNSYSTSAIELLADIDTYRMTVKTYVNHWMSTDDRPCFEGKPNIYPNTVCKDTCIKLNVRKKYPNAIDTFVDNGITELKFNLETISFIKTSATQSSQSSTIDEDTLKNNTNWQTGVSKLNKICENQCAGVRGCENWRFDVFDASSSMYSTMSTITEKVTTKLVIQYPSANEILIVSEVPKQSWDGFVGNIGGIVGVWTGASILSFIQLFYLCCCAPQDEASEPHQPIQHINNVVRIHTVSLHSRK